MQIEVEKLSKEKRILMRYIQKLEEDLKSCQVNFAYIYHNLECYLIQLFVTNCRTL